MTTLLEAAKAYVPSNIRNIAELQFVELNVPMMDRLAKDKEGKEFKYTVALINDVEYRVPRTVLNDIKTILGAMPNLKRIKVIRKGEGRDAKYTTIPLD